MRADKKQLIILSLLATALTYAVTASLRGAASDDQAQRRPEVTSALTGRILFTSIPARPVGGAAPGVPPSHTVALDDLPSGARICLLETSKPGHPIRHLRPDFAAAGHPSLSFAADRILFVGKKRPTDDFQIWEMSAEGGEARQVTPTGSAVTQSSRAIYLSTLYGMDQQEPLDYIAFTGRPKGSRDQRDSIFICRPDGSDLRQITFTPCGVGAPLLLSDGRLVFHAGENGDGDTASTCGPAALMTVYPDGTDFFLFTDVGVGQVAITPCETPSEQIVYVERPTDSPAAGGQLVAVSRRRPLHARQQLTSSENGRYLTPSAVDDSTLLVSYRAADDTAFGLYLFDLRTEKRTHAVLNTADEHVIDGVMIKARPRPPGRSSVVRSAESRGSLYCLDPYLSQEATSTAVDRIRSVNVYTTQTRRIGQNGGEKLIGSIPVELDGSFFAEVPARTPLRLETLGPDGQVLRRMESWFWVMPKEARGCIGCHEDRELTPPNRFARALRQRPVRLELAGPKDAPATRDTEGKP